VEGPAAVSDSARGGPPQSDLPVVRAAGALPWRHQRGLLQVALVHRPRYDDWAWPKGKLDPGEQPPVAAAREVQEETGHVVRLGRTLPTSTYTVKDRTGAPVTKEVRYWAAEVIGGDGILEHEIDEVAWLDAATASTRLDYPHDQDQLRALVRADDEGTLATWPLALIRHARAIPRGAWSGDDDRLRPLDRAGKERAREIVPLLTAYDVRRLVSSDAVRCADTLAPYAAAIRARLHLRPGLSEEGHRADPSKSLRTLSRLLTRGKPCALCSHGDVLPALLDHVRSLAKETDPSVAQTLTEAIDQRMVKGEVLIAHVVGTGEHARVVDVERHRP
jgi:8-oxo-dGTP pyrophosphatase MutT (NUDIX family)